MLRIHAREIVVQMSYALAMSGEEPQGALGVLFEPKYFVTLTIEPELAEIFAEEPDEASRSYITDLVCGIAEHLPELNSYIERYSRGWSVARISNIARAVLNTAMYEVMYYPEVPPRSALNAAIEILKGYEDERTVKFVNGILGAFVRGEVPDAT